MIVCIAEKPSVGRDIARVLGANKSNDGYMEGNGYQVTWVFGHLCTLKDPEDYDEKYKKWKLEDLPIIPENFGIKLIDNKGQKKQFGIIKNLVLKASEVINCGDAGQEGELIQRWVLQKIGVKCPVKRLWINSMTDEAIKEGFKNLQAAYKYDNLYQAGLARTIGDWLLGMNATRLYTLKYGNGKGVLSLGRVQTPTLAMITSRQEKIDNFKPRPYWVLSTIYRNITFKAERGNIDAVGEKECVSSNLSLLASQAFVIKDITNKPGKSLAPRLYDLTSLQVDSNKKYGLSAEETLKAIQALYEHKLVTYPRVDTKYLPDDVYPTCPNIFKALAKNADYGRFIEKLIPENLPKSNRIFDKKKVTDHHAIIPTGVTTYSFKDNELKVYELIVLRFIAAFSPDCEFDTTTVIATAGGESFKVNSKTIIKEGWREVYGKEFFNEDDPKEGYDEENITLPKFYVGESGPHKPGLAEKQTKPPKLYTEASLLRAMETAGKFVEDEETRAALKENGIGRPSSRASIIETLFNRKYLSKNKRRINITEKGKRIISLIKEPLLKSPELTGIWEKRLREIEKGEYSSKDFINGLKQQITDIVLGETR